MLLSPAFHFVLFYLVLVLLVSLVFFLMLRLMVNLSTCQHGDWHRVKIAGTAGQPNLQCLMVKRMKRMAIKQESPWPQTG